MKDVIIFASGVIVGATLVVIQREKPVLMLDQLGSFLACAGVKLVDEFKRNVQGESDQDSVESKSSRVADPTPEASQAAESTA